MNENNQYGNTMTKPLPTGSIKRAKKFQTMVEFDLIVQGISDTTKLDIYSLLTLNLTTKMQQKINYFLMKFIHQFLPMKDRYLNFLTP